MSKLLLFMTWDVSLQLWQEKGLYQREIKLYQELAKEGVDITFLSWGDEKDLELKPVGINVIPVYQYMWRPDDKFLRAMVSLFVPFVMWSKLSKFDLLKTNQMWGSWVAVICKWFYARPLLLRCGFELYDFTVKQGQGMLRRWLTWFVCWMGYRGCDHAYVATSDDRDFVLKTFYIPAERISVHPNWIDTEFFKPKKAEEKEKSILFVGRLTEQKNLQELIDAVKDTDWILDIIGDGELKDQLYTKGAHVNFMGHVPNDELPGLYNSRQVYVLPSHYEGNPKTLLEAMSCGRAVVGSDVPGIRNLITHDKTGLLAAPNALSLRAMIKRLMDDPALREKLGKAAREHITDSHTLSALVKKELALYKSLL